MKKKLSDLDKARGLLPQFIWPHDPGTPLSLAEASKLLRDIDPNQYYRLNDFLGPLLTDEEEDIRKPLEISGVAPEIIRQHLKRHKEQQARVAKIVLRLIPDDLPTFDEALAQLDVDNPELFFRLVPLCGPTLLEMKEVRLAIGRWFRWKSSANPAHRKLGQRYLKRLGTQLAYIKKGRVSKKPEHARQAARREQTRDRKRGFDASIKKKKEELLAEIVERSRHEIPPARERVLDRTGSLRCERARIARSVLAEAQNSPDTATKNAATEILKLIQPRKLSRPKP
jgi:hypothetical protein